MGEGTGFNSKIANNISTTYMKQKSFVVIEKDIFQAININIPGITTKNNRAHVEVMGYLSTTYDLNPTYQYPILWL